MTFAMPRSTELSAFHDAYIVSSTSPTPVSSALWEAIARNHRFNNLLWAEEDLARRANVADAEIAANKRAIDRFNQNRNDATEVVDELILSALASVARARSCRLNCETAGSIIDRLSILSLKIYHMRLQTERLDADANHIERCVRKLELLGAQRVDLMNCFDTLIDDCLAGRAFYKIYRQFKMYNDPTLNPHLYAASSGGSTQTR